MGRRKGPERHQDSFEAIKLSQLKDGDFIKFSFGMTDNIQSGTVSNVEVLRWGGKVKFMIGDFSFEMSKGRTVQRRVKDSNTSS